MTDLCMDQSVELNEMIHAIGMHLSAITQSEAVSTALHVILRYQVTDPIWPDFMAVPLWEKHL